MPEEIEPPKDRVVWTEEQMMECLRYGFLVVFTKQHISTKSICRRVRRKGTYFYIESDRHMVMLPESFFKEGPGGVVPGDLIFISTDGTCTILRSITDDTYFKVVNGRIRSNHPNMKGQ